MDPITYLFDSKAKDLIFFVCFCRSFSSQVLSLLIASSSISFFLLLRVIEDGLPIIHFSFLTSVHFSLLNLVSFCDHRAYLLLSLPRGLEISFHCHLLLKSQSGNQHLLVSWITLKVRSVSSRTLTFPLGPKDIIPFPHSLNKSAHISLK